ncbi:hypothetical protein THAOC_24700 [Thalassiosira oceanica]|uniref:Uncharacterized protein n=1 Tax=Thalassiosira oceanica TaxID=159749 RepID=K0RR63_THAOC|nr:hypothetical protein THAOC_24700 [Thalassiosira oceanica]|eukprot:EJK55560.1 hypothetical protein THAOC_24700 [Thalassiosira oceanica]
MAVDVRRTLGYCVHASTSPLTVKVQGRLRSAAAAPLRLPAGSAGTTQAASGHHGLTNWHGRNVRGGEDNSWGKARKDGTVPSTLQHNLPRRRLVDSWRFEKRARPVIIMGKKACLALDTNDYTDDYADIEETWFDQHDHDEEERPPSPIEAARLGRSRTRQNDTCVVATNESTVMTPRLARTFSDRQPKPTVITPRLGKTAYIGNPLRWPVFTEMLASNDALLVQTLSFLDLLDVVTLSKVSTGLREQIDSFEGLFCRIESSLSSDGNLLPCLLPIKGRLLTLSSELPRPAGLCRRFAYECLSQTVYKSSSGKNVLAPRQLYCVHTSEYTCAMSFRNLRWQYTNFKGPQRQLFWKSGLRLTHVCNEQNKCALTTVWLSVLPEDKAFTIKYLPPNTETIVGSAIHEDRSLCAILATVNERYVLSMIALPLAPGDASGNSHGHELKWQKNLSSNWQFFSSSETRSIVSFNSKGTLLVFGSTERWGAIDSKTGRHLWKGSILNPSRAIKNTSSRMSETSVITAYLIHKEFLFLLLDRGTQLCVFDVSDTRNSQPIAESNNLNWSESFTHSCTRQRWSSAGKFSLAFCGGRLFVAGYSDLIVSKQSRLLRRFRSRLQDLRSARCPDGSLVLRFDRLSDSLSGAVGTQVMHTPNERELFLLGASSLLRWTESQGLVSMETSGHARIHHVDETKFLTSSATGGGIVITQRDQSKILSCMGIHHKRYFNSEKSGAHHTEVLKVVCDGRFVLIRCKKTAVKTIVLDLYNTAN